MAVPDRPYGMERSASPSSQVIDSSIHGKVGNVDIGKSHASASHVLGRHVCASIWALLTP